MVKPRSSRASAVPEGWGTWEDAERWSRQAFQGCSPLDRLAWLENVLELRNAVMSGPATACGNGKTPPAVSAKFKAQDDGA